MWNSETNIKGPPGPEGPIGPQGIQGPPGSSSGDMVGPASAVTDNIAVFSGTTGKLLKDGLKKIADLVLRAGDIMTGNLTIQNTSPGVILDRSTVAAQGFIGFRRLGAQRWSFVCDDTIAETGGNTGSPLYLNRNSDAGGSLGKPLQFDRATGLGVVEGNPTAALGIATKQYVDGGDALQVLKTGDTMSGNLRFQTFLGEYSARMAVRGINVGAAAFEWGHANTLAQYASTIGAESASGYPYIGFSCGPGSAASSYKAGAAIGTLFRGSLSGGWGIYQVAANTDNQTFASLTPMIAQSSTITTVYTYYNKFTNAGNAANLNSTTLVIDKSDAAAVAAVIQGQREGVGRWSLYLGDATTETGVDGIGSHFRLYSHNNAGSATTRWTINRQTGLWTVIGDMNITGSITASGSIDVAAATIGGSQCFGNIPSAGTKTTSYTTVLADAQKMIVCAATGVMTVSIPLNSAVAYPIGTILTIVSRQTPVVTIALTAGGTMFLGGGTSATGNRSLAANSVATVLKVSTDIWFITGAGVT